MWLGNPEEWGKGEYRDVPICKLVKLARARQIRDLERSLNDPNFPFYFDTEAADHAVWFIEQLKQFDGEWHGQPLKLSDWQEWDIIRPIFGWKRKSDGSRKFRTAYIEIPRRNGKSTLLAAIGLYMLMADREYGAQVYAAATKEQQARIVWDAGRKMILATPELREEIQAFKTSIVSLELGSRFMPLGRDSKSQDGFSVHCGIIDEYHAHKTADMYDVLSSGRGSRKQPLLIIITTAGSGIATPCKQESDLAKSILQGTIENDAYFAYVTTVDDPNNWRDPIEWQKANPNWGISVYPDGFMDEFREADQKVTKQPGFLRKKLNIWTQAATAWLSLDEWRQCVGDVDLAQLKGKPCWGGIDLSSTRDITAIILLFQLTGKLVPIPFFFCPKASIEARSKADGVTYDAWVREGYLTATEGNVVDYSYVERKILELSTEFDIKSIGYDPWNATDIVLRLTGAGLKMVECRQGFSSLSAPSKRLEELLGAGGIQHGGNPILTWMASNVVKAEDAAGNIKPVKNISADKIDGIAALIIAIREYMLTPIEPEFIYNTQGVHAI